LQFESRLSDWNSIPLRQAPQLLQGEPAAAAGLGDQNARPNALRTWITQACLCTHRRQPIGDHRLRYPRVVRHRPVEL